MPTTDFVGPTPAFDDGDNTINAGEETVDTAPVETTKVIEPKTRMEYFLNKIADAVNGEGGGSGGSTEPVIVTITPAGSAYTWSGATWEGLTDAFMHNMAGGKMLINETTAEYFWLTFMEINPNREAICCLTPIGSLSLLPDGTIEVRSQ